MSFSASPAIELRDLRFAYPGDLAVLEGLSLSVPVGARVLLLGANGVGKSTLLRLVAGRHMIDRDMVRVHGRPAFHDTTLAAEVAFLGGAFPFNADIGVGEILAGRPGIDPVRRDEVMRILDVDPAWRMNRLSDGQRRRVQILLDLERGTRVVLLDEVTAELDVLARADLLELLRRDSERRGVTIVYASHVLDGLDSWGTHLLFLGRRRVRAWAPLSEVAELRDRVDGAHRGRGWEPVAGSHDDGVGGGRALPAGAHRGRGWEPVAGSHDDGAGEPAPLVGLALAWMREDRASSRAG